MDVLTTVDAARYEALRHRDEFFWIDLASPSDAEIARLGSALGLHPLALEDTREFGQPPKLDHFGDHVLLVFYSASECGDERGFEPLEVHVYIAGSFVLTVRRAPCPSLERLRARLAAADAAEADVVYEVLDVLADALLDVIDRIEDRIDALEGEVLDRVQQAHARRIYRLKQTVRDLERRAVQQRDHFDEDAEAILALPGFEPGRRRYLDDVGDHLVQAVGELTRQADDLQALTGTYFNANAQRLNVVVARLSVVAAFFFVWTLVTSFFGQNFGWLVDHIDGRGEFLLYGVGGLAASTVLAAAVLWWRRRDLF